MSFLDRFTSRQGKATPQAPKAADKKATVKAKDETAKKAAFKAVPSGESAEKKVATTTVQKASTDQAYRILLAAAVTEKSTRLSRQSQIMFHVAPTATKMDVRNAVQQVYGVRPIAVNMVRLPGKILRYGRTKGRQVARKKAIVTLPPGKSIDVVSA